MMIDPRPLVLICDDEAPLRELIRVILGAGYRFREAATVADSIDAVRVEPPDLVLLDLMLPGGSGLGVLRAIRDDHALDGTRVAVVSAWSDETNRAAAEEAGADAFVAKPFAPQQLEDWVEELLEPGRSGRVQR
jgi:two-component system phosphate regulon response regulator PhoB